MALRFKMSFLLGSVPFRWILSHSAWAPKPGILQGFVVAVGQLVSTQPSARVECSRFIKTENHLILSELRKHMVHKDS